MISRQELLDLAADFGLAANVVEKDYALGWVLAAIGEHATTRNTWLFKGGTCLKKCFFETYRFSEDLDFTLLEPAHLDGAFLAALFNDIAKWVYDETGLVLPPDARKVEIFTNSRGGRSGEGRIGYRGPLARAGDPPRIKLDLTDHERVVLPAVRRAVHHPYSDMRAAGMSVATYPFEELFAEKLRALAERLRPRDLFDVVHIYRHRELDLDRHSVVQTLQEKCDFRGIAVPTLLSLRASSLIDELRAGWGQMLAHQLPQLPSFDAFWEELPAALTWLFEDTGRVALPTIGLSEPEAVDDTWRAPAMATSWRSSGVSAPLELVRFAASNYLCVDLDYRDEQGRRRSRVIEPYALRRTAAGKLLLCTVKTATGETRTYRVDRIIGVSVTQQSFKPRFLVELTGSGPLSAPPARLTSIATVGGLKRFQKPRRVTRVIGSPSGTRHVYRCSVCGKTFKKRIFGGTLGPHKGKNGHPCYGRIGIFVRTER